MAKRHAPTASKAEPKKVRALEDGQYRATVAFAHKLDRVERGSVLSLKAEEAAMLGDMVEFLPPVVEVQPKQSNDDGSANDQGDGDALNGDAPLTPTAPSAPIEGATGEANKDQIV